SDHLSSRVLPMPGPLSLHITCPGRKTVLSFRRRFTRRLKNMLVNSPKVFALCQANLKSSVIVAMRFSSGTWTCLVIAISRFAFSIMESIVVRSHSEVGRDVRKFRLDEDLPLRGTFKYTPPLGRVASGRIVRINVSLLITSQSL